MCVCSSLTFTRVSVVRPRPCWWFLKTGAGWLHSQMVSLPQWASLSLNWTFRLLPKSTPLPFPAQPSQVGLAQKGCSVFSQSEAFLGNFEPGSGKSLCNTIPSPTPKPPLSSQIRNLPRNGVSYNIERPPWDKDRGEGVQARGGWCLAAPSATVLSAPVSLGHPGIVLWLLFLQEILPIVWFFAFLVVIPTA